MHAWQLVIMPAKQWSKAMGQAVGFYHIALKVRMQCISQAYTGLAMCLYQQHFEGCCNAACACRYQVAGSFQGTRLRYWELQGGHAVLKGGTGTMTSGNTA